MKGRHELPPTEGEVVEGWDGILELQGIHPFEAGGEGPELQGCLVGVIRPLADVDRMGARDIGDDTPPVTVGACVGLAFESGNGKGQQKTRVMVRQVFAESFEVG